MVGKEFQGILMFVDDSIKVPQALDSDRLKKVNVMAFHIKQNCEFNQGCTMNKLCRSFIALTYHI
jgi:hypothetical protein